MVLESVKKAKETPQVGLSEWDTWKPVTTVLIQGADGEFAYRESFDLRMKAAGEKLPEHDFMTRTLISGLRHLQWLPEPSRIVVKTNESVPSNVCLTQHWRTPGGESCRFTAAAKVNIEPGASADIIFEISPNGDDWIARSTTIENDVIRIDSPQPGGEIHTRLRV